MRSKSIASDSFGQNQVLVEQSHSLGMSCAKVGIFVQIHHCGFNGFLNGLQGLWLESETAFSVGWVQLVNVGFGELIGNMTN
jgi:hypothetical protein